MRETELRIFNDLSVCGWNIFTSEQAKREVAIILAEKGYVRARTLLDEVFSEISEAVESDKTPEELKAQLDIIKQRYQKENGLGLTCAECKECRQGWLLSLPHEFVCLAGYEPRIIKDRNQKCDHERFPY